MTTKATSPKGRYAELEKTTYDILNEGKYWNTASIILYWQSRAKGMQVWRRKDTVTGTILVAAAILIVGITLNMLDANKTLADMIPLLVGLVIVAVLYSVYRKSLWFLPGEGLVNKHVGAYIKARDELPEERELHQRIAQQVRAALEELKEQVKAEQRAYEQSGKRNRLFQEYPET